MSTETAETRPTPPPLVAVLPDCSLCGQQVQYDEGLFCTTCGASWSSKLFHLDGFSQWDDPSAPQCPAEVRPWLGSTRWPLIAGRVERCLLTAGHDPKRHRSSEHDWADADADGYRAEVGAL
jgi:hypothetical protein